MYTIVDATEKDIPKIQAIAEKTWWPTYSSILSAEQLSFMLAFIYNEQSLKENFQQNKQYFLMLHDEKGAQGFAAHAPRPEDVTIWKLHKLYVLPDNHGKGYGKKLLEEVISRARKSGAVFIDLNVNRYNPAKTFYEKIGFQVMREEDVPVGPYWMNDFVMRLKI